MRALWILPILLVCGCNTPQIPLPPPEWNEFSVTVNAADEQISFNGTLPLAGGELFIIDPATGNGIIRRIEANGVFDTGLFDAQDGQLFAGHYTDGDDSSDPSCFIVDYSVPELVDVGDCPK